MRLVWLLVACAHATSSVPSELQTPCGAKNPNLPGIGPMGVALGGDSSTTRTVTVVPTLKRGLGTALC